MLTNLMKWLRGILYIQVIGTAPERFINLCSNKKILIWNLTKVDGGFEFFISARNYKHLKPIARKTGLVPKIKDKSGLPFVLHKYRKRKGFFIGILMCIILIYMMSLFIWDISILGGSKYTPEAMIKFLNDNQVYTGIKKNLVDCQEIEETIRLTYKDIGWVSAEIKGTRLIIKITETNMPAPAQKAIEPSHIIAAKDGIIQEIVTRSGTPLVKVGDVVQKGDILVSGILTIKGDFDEILRLQPVVADADIVCKSYYDYNESFSMKYNEKNFSGATKKGYFITLFGKKLFLYNPRNSYSKYDIIVNEKTMHVTDSFYLPFRYGSILSREYELEKKSYSKEEATALAESKLNRYIKKLMEKDVRITDNKVEITIDNNYCKAIGRIFVQEPAWEYKTIVEDEWRIEQEDEHNGNDH